MTVTPAAADAIYDANDNAASVDHLRNSASLHDQSLPTIVSITNNLNEYIDVNFSEPVFGNVNGYSNLATNDFKLSIAGGTAGLSQDCLLYTSPSPRDRSLTRMPSSA